MSKKIIFAFLGAILIWPQLATRANAQDERASFSLTINANSPEIRVGSRLWIIVTMTNMTGHAIDCTEISQNGLNIAYHYELIDEDGKPAEKATRSHMDTEPQDIHPCQLQADGNQKSEVLITRAYKLDRIGKYTIQVWRFEPDLKDDKGDPIKVKSNKLTISVVG